MDYANLTRAERLKVNTNLRLLDRAFKTDVGVVKLSAANTLEHELAKCRVCYELLKAGTPFVTEARFKNYGRADVFDLLTGVALEIVVSETEESLCKKAGAYPVPISTIKC